MKKLYLILLFLPAALFAQGKTLLDFNNERTHVLQGCEGTENILDCYNSTISAIVRDAVNSYSVNKPFGNEIIIDLLMANHPSGKVTPLKVSSDDPDVEAVVKKALENLPQAAPPTAYGSDPGKSTNAISVKLIKNAAGTQYDLPVAKSNTEQWKKDPHPFAGSITPARFYGCDDPAEKGCNASALQRWLMKQIDGKIEKDFEERVVIRLTFDDTGKLTNSTFSTKSDKLLKVLEAAFKKFPRITPAMMMGRSIHTTYSTAVTINTK